MSKKLSKLIKDMTPYLKEFLDNNDMYYSRFPIPNKKSDKYFIRVTLERFEEIKCATVKD